MPTPHTGPGRPTKYGRPSQRVTLTLPRDVITRLRAVDADLGRAIVSVTERSAPAGHRSRPAEIVGWGRQAVIIVVPSRAMRRLPGVELVPAGGGRALIALEHPNSVSQLELDLHDALDGPDVTAVERESLSGVADILREARHAQRVRLKERSIIVLEWTGRRRAGAALP